MDYLFFRRSLNPLPMSVEPRPDLNMELWRPSAGRPLPPGVPVMPFAAWSLFHYLGVFASQDYTVSLMRRGGTLVNRTCVLPPHFKFPFMAKGDLQIAGIWTDPAQRGGGLAFRAVQEVLRRFERPGRVIWYMVQEGNAASIRLAEKTQFQFYGWGQREPRLGLPFLGRFQVATLAPPEPVPGPGNRPGRPHAPPGAGP